MRSQPPQAGKHAASLPLVIGCMVSLPDGGLWAAAKELQAQVFMSVPGTLQPSCTHMDIPGSAPSAAGTSGSGGPSTATWGGRHAHLLGAHLRIRIKLRIGACTFIAQSEAGPKVRHRVQNGAFCSPTLPPESGGCAPAATAASYNHILSRVTCSSPPGFDLAQGWTNQFNWAHIQPRPGCRPHYVGNGTVRIVSSSGSWRGQQQPWASSWA